MDGGALPGDRRFETQTGMAIAVFPGESAATRGIILS
jgi:hypothetical protein